MKNVPPEQHPDLRAAAHNIQRISLEDMRNAYAYRPDVRREALKEERRRPWTDEERRRFVAAGGLQ